MIFDMPASIDYQHNAQLHTSGYDDLLGSFG